MNPVDLMISPVSIGNMVLKAKGSFYKHPLNSKRERTRSSRLLSKKTPSFRQGPEGTVNHFDHFIRVNQGHCIRMMNPQVIILCFRARQVLVEGFVVFVHAILLLHVGTGQRRVRHCVKTYHRSPQGSCHMDATGVRSYKQIE